MDAGRRTPTPIWSPSPARIERATLTRFTGFVEERHGCRFADYDELWRWSVENLELFWATLADHFGVRFASPPDCVLRERVMPGAAWFPGATLSYAEHVLRAGEDGDVAIIHASELSALTELTWAQLRAQVAELAGGLRALGVAPGDRVAAYMHNGPETLAAFLACASIGAVWSVCSPDFGPASVLDRFAQIEPVVLLASTGYGYGGRLHDRREVIEQLRSGLPSLRAAFALDRLGVGTPDGCEPWHELTTAGADAPLRFEQVAFDHPLWILYTSGTSGPPKPIVHGHGGILLEQLKRMALHVDLHPRERFFWFTTTGWMLWNVLPGALLTGAAVVLYDGDPLHPGPQAMWRLAEQARVSCFGAGAAYLTRLMKAGFEPRAEHDLSALRAVGSSGSPLSREAFEWVYRVLGEDIWLFSSSGGTDVCTSFVGGVPTLPVYAGELQARALGVGVHAFDEAGNAVIGEVGEMVITEPMPSMPLALWGDTDGSRYRAAYFERYPGAWCHGDWLEITERGTAVIHGRSDSTINRGGVRIGTSEIYRAVAGEAAVTDALVVDVPLRGGESWLVLFVVLAEHARLDEELTAALRRCIRERCSPRHLPDEVIAIDEVPRTLSGKPTEIPVKRILMGQPVAQVASADSLSNPRALDFFVALAAERALEPAGAGPARAAGGAAGAS